MSAILLLVALALFKQTAAQNPAVSIRCYDDCGASDGKTCPTVMKGCVACSYIEFWKNNQIIEYRRVCEKWACYPFQGSFGDIETRHYCCSDDLCNESLAKANKKLVPSVGSRG
ncbi:unnamed protein product [Dicrocoelium dendriticum]|nr:unnamed protein product [Dicrocoelium dendriticum]